MSAGRLIQEWQTPETFLGKASVDQLIPHAKTGHFPRGSIVCTSDQLGECVYLVLKGRCELRHKPGVDGRIGVQTFDTGKTFGGWVDSTPVPGGEVAAIQDSVVLAVRVEDLAKLAGKPGLGSALVRFLKSRFFAPGRETVAPVTNSTTPNGERPVALENNHSSNTSFFFSNPRNRVVSFVFLSNTLPPTVLSERIACQLQEETDKQAILVQFETGTNSAQPEDLDHKINGTASLSDEFYRDETGLHQLRLKLGGNPPDPEVVGELFRKLRRRFNFVLVAVQAEQLPSAFLFQCVMWSDAAHFFLRPSVEDLYQLDLLLHELRPCLSRRVASELKPVLCLAQGETVGSFDERMAAAGMAHPLLIRECPREAKFEPPHPPSPGYGAAGVGSCND